MYLSRVELNAYRRTTIEAMGSPQLIHAAVMASFTSDALNERVLWRIDRIGAATYLLVQSQKRPDFQHIVDQFGWPDSEQGWDTLEYGPFLDKLEPGQVWRFRLSANPVKSIKGSDAGARGKVVPHITVSQQEQWLIDRALGLGFEIVKLEEGEFNLDVVHRETRKFKRGDKNNVTLSVATFEGVLEIKDEAVFKETVVKGIGRAKGYGCGMLTIGKP